jgi:hypothetical protein
LKAFLYYWLRALNFFQTFKTKLKSKKPKALISFPGPIRW